MSTQRAALIFVMGLIVCGVVWTRHAEGTVSPIPQKRNIAPAKVSGAIPEHIYYGQVFSLLVKLGNKDDYQRDAQLTDEQTARLLQIAADCEAETNALDQKAQVIILEFRKQIDQSQIKKDKPLPIPAGLDELQGERDAAVLRHRDQLRNVLGEEAFSRFKEASKTIVRIDLTSAQ
jgi:hypothetical protein